MTVADFVLDEQGLEDVFARPTDGAADVGVQEIPWPVAGNNKPESLRAVDSDQVGC